MKIHAKFGRLITLLLLFSLAVVPAGAQLSGCKDEFLGNYPLVSGDKSKWEDYVAKVDGHNRLRLCKRNSEVTYFAISFDLGNKIPEWVAYYLDSKRLTPFQEGKNVYDSDMAREKGTGFSPDAAVHRALQANHWTYEASDNVAPDNSKYARGHLVPSSDMLWSIDANLQTFLYSNAIPQYGHGLNSGPWNTLERRVRKWAIQTKGKIYIVTGVYGLRKTGKGATSIGGDINWVSVPACLYKVIYKPGANGKYEAIAFLMPNENQTGKDIDLFAMSIGELEKKSKITFDKSLLEHDKDTVSWTAWDIKKPQIEMSCISQK